MTVQDTLFFPRILYCKYDVITVNMTVPFTWQLLSQEMAIFSPSSLAPVWENPDASAFFILSTVKIPPPQIHHCDLAVAPQLMVEYIPPYLPPNITLWDSHYAPTLRLWPVCDYGNRQERITYHPDIPTESKDAQYCPSEGTHVTSAGMY